MTRITLLIDLHRTLPRCCGRLAGISPASASTSLYLGSRKELYARARDVVAGGLQQVGPGPVIPSGSPRIGVAHAVLQRMEGCPPVQGDRREVVALLRRHLMKGTLSALEWDE